MATDPLPGTGGASTADPSTLSLATDGQGTYRGYHDMEMDGLSETVTLLLAEVDGREPTELVGGFGQYADPDALDRLFRTRPNGESRGPGRVELAIAGYDVTIHSDGEIVIEA